MSLTYPVLNDILFDKLSSANVLIKSLEEQLKEHINISQTYRVNTTERISNHNIKLDLIHDLFKHYKANIIPTPSQNISQQELDTLKNNQTFMANSIKLEYDNIVNNLKTQLKQNNEMILKRVQQSMAGQNGNTLQLNINAIESKLQILTKSYKELVHSHHNYIGLHKTQQYNTSTIHNINYRLNSLESRYVALESKLSKYTNLLDIPNTDKNTFSVLGDNSDSSDSSGDNDCNKSTDDVNTKSHNWIKVTKRHKT
jgi:hypothetical protein